MKEPKNRKYSENSKLFNWSGVHSVLDIGEGDMKLEIKVGTNCVKNREEPTKVFRAEEQHDIIVLYIPEICYSIQLFFPFEFLPVICFNFCMLH